MKLSNEYIRGLIEGEGCFTFHTRDAVKTRKARIPTFALSMHERDKYLIEAVRDPFRIEK